jgi:cytochrome c
MRMSLAIPAVLVLVACSTEPPAAWQMGDPAVGHQVARDLCADCHAIERTGDSRNPTAPPFRTILANYPPEWLATDLHESRVIGFRKMPVFHFGEGHEYDLVAYLLSIQETRPSQPTLGPPR